MKSTSINSYGLRIGLSFLILFIIVAVSWAKAWPAFSERLELSIYNWKVQQFAINQAENRITIVEIDERSLKLEGSWPWPREKFANILHILKDDYMVSVIGLDVFFPEAKNPVSDALLAEAITRTQTVLPIVFSQDKLTQGILGAATPLDLIDSFQTRQAQGYIANGDFMPSNYTAGHISPIIDVDGVIRKFTPIIEYKGQHYEALTIAMVRQLFGINSLVVKKANSLASQYNDIFLPGLVRIPIDNQGQALIPYTHVSGNFRYVSASDVLSKSVPINEMVGSLVLIGSSATGLHDVVATPISSQLPGVEVHAHILAGLIDGGFIATSNMEVQYEAVAMLLIACLAILFIRNLSPIPVLATLLGLSIAWVVANLLVWKIIGLNLPMLPPLIYITALLIMNFVLSLQLSGKQTHRLMKSFERYVPALVAQASINKTSEMLAASERPVTTMFFDLRGFTAWSERQTAQDVHQYIATVMQEVSNIITQHDGIIDKYMGDSVMAFWDSQSCPHHAQKAVNAAIAIELYFNKDYAAGAKASEPLEYGIGINSGVAMVGQMGTTERASYTVMGDVINVASRLQTLSGTMGCHIILGSETAEQLEGIPYRSLGEVKLRGRQNTVLIHTPTIPIVSLNL